MEPVNTRASPSQVLAALLDTGLTHRQAHFLAAQSALETARWQDGFWNWNLGNITTFSKDPEKFATLQTKDGPLNIKVYATLEEGAFDFVRYLKAHSRSGDLLELAEVQDFGNYVDRLVERKYFIVHPPDYTAEKYLSGMHARFDWLKSIFSKGGLVEEAYGEIKSSWEVIATLVAFAAGVGYLWEKSREKFG